MSRLYECVACRGRRTREEGVPPGACPCGPSHPAPWRVLPPGTPPRARAPGHVIVLSHLGAQELRGPAWREDPAAWTPYPGDTQEEDADRGGMPVLSRLTDPRTFR